MVDPILIVELLFFAIFGQTSHVQFKKVHMSQPTWTDGLFKVAFGIYMLVSVVVLINLLIAMMSDTYQRIQAQSDIEWKYGLSKLIRNMHRWDLIDTRDVPTIFLLFLSRSLSLFFLAWSFPWDEKGDVPLASFAELCLRFFFLLIKTTEIENFLKILGNSMNWVFEIKREVTASFRGWRIRVSWGLSCWK